MIEARNFVEAARQRGFRWYAGVPCSFLTPFINYVLQDPSLHYLSMANEGDAVAFIAGVALAGDASAPHGRGIAMMQNSGLGNAVSPLVICSEVARRVSSVVNATDTVCAGAPNMAVNCPVGATVLTALLLVVAA